MDNTKIGVLWIKTNEKGEYFSGTIKNEKGEEERIVIFRNKYKEKEKQPDYIILKAKQQETNNDDLPF